MKRTLFLIFLLCTFAFYISADKGHTNIKDVEITAQIDSLQKIADNFYNAKDFHQSLKYYTLISELCKKQFDEKHPEYAYSLDKIACCHFYSANYNEAIKYFQQSLDIIGGSMGETHEYYAVYLSWIGSCYEGLGLYKEALNYAQKALNVREIAIGTEHIDYARSLNNIAVYLSKLGDYKNAIEYNIQAMHIRENKLGKNTLDYAVSLCNIGYCYLELNNYSSALNYTLDAITILKNTVGGNNNYYASCLNNLGCCYTRLNNYDKALEYHIEAINIKENLFGKNHPDYAISLCNIGECYYKLENFNLAISYTQKALTILDKTLGIEHPYYAISLCNLSCCYLALEDYENTLEYTTLALSLFESKSETYNPYYAKSLNNLAKLYVKINEFNEAIKYQIQAIEITEKTLGKDNLDYALLLCDVADSYNYLGDFNKALKYSTIALEVFEHKFSKEDLNYIKVLNNIASCLNELGEYIKAIEYHSYILNIKKKILGEEHHDYAITLNNLAICYFNLGNYNKAIEYSTEALQITKNTNDKLLNAKIFNIIANCYAELNDYYNALYFSKSALTILEADADKYFQDFIITLNNLANFLLQSGDYNSALDIHYKILETREALTGKDNLNYATTLNNIASCYSYLNNYDKAIEYYSQAIDIKNKIIGKEHPEYQLSIQNISVCHLKSHNNAFSETAKEFTELNIASICKTFVDLSLNERKLFWDKHSYWYDGPIHQGVCEFNDASLLPTAYNSVLFSKGLLLNAEIAMRDLLEEYNDPVAIELYNELLSTRSVLNKQYELASEKRFLSTDSLENRVDELERQLITRSKVYGDYTRNLQLRWTDVQSRLSDKDIAIEFASFSDENSTTYIAYFLKKGYKAPAYKKILTHNNDENLNNSEIYLSAEFSKTLWGALKEELSGVENIYFAPTGELYNIAIESLPYWENPSMLVSDKWNFFRLSSTRELALNKERYNSKSAAVYGGLKYDTATNQLSTTDEFNYNPLDVDAIGLRSGVEYLPGSHNEALLIDKLLKSNKVYDKLYLGEAGTETTLKALGGEYVNMLHIATHGFYWTEREARRMDFQFLNNQNKNVEDKMLSRSGLLFAGANNILSGKEIPGNIDDGVLTAEEISRIDLRGLDLLVLSACQTGLGEISGEGVFGLQRGFKKAGAQSILMSLWNVDDKATQLFMSKFYELLLADKDNPHNKRNAHLNAQQFVKNYEIDMNSISSHELEYYKENGAAINYNTGKVKPFSNHKFWAAFILLDAI